MNDWVHKLPQAILLLIMGIIIVIALIFDSACLILGFLGALTLSSLYYSSILAWLKPELYYKSLLIRSGGIFWPKSKEWKLLMGRVLDPLVLLIILSGTFIVVFLSETPLYMSC